MSEKSDLTVLTVAENDSGILDLMIRSVYKFTNPSPDIIICDQGRNGSLLEKYNWDHNVTVVENSPKLLLGSNRHGAGLSKIFPLVKTKRTAIIESDCILLRSGWDNLDLSKNKMLAAKKLERAGHLYYHICFMVFETDLLRRNGTIDFRPGTKKTRGNRSYDLWEDVGFNIKNKVKPNEVKLMEFVDCKSGGGKYFGEKFQSDEFFIDGKSTLAHHGRGSNISGKSVREGFDHPKEQLIKWKEKASRILGLLK